MEFDQWLSTICIQEPPSYVKDLARQAWNYARQLPKEGESGLSTVKCNAALPKINDELLDEYYPWLIADDGNGGYSWNQAAVDFGCVLRTECHRRSQQDYENAVSERDPCPVIEAHCDYYSYQYDINGEVVICHCVHPDNPNEHEGNCTHALCPLLLPSDEYS